MKYGYLRWIIDEEKKIYSAIGDGRNVIYINSNTKIVVTITSSFKPMVFDLVDFIQRYIEKLLNFTLIKLITICRREDFNQYQYYILNFIILQLPINCNK